MNVETVVSDRTDLPRDTKGQKRPFLFKTHPAGIRHLVRTGFNLASLANNHSMDFGVPLLKQTLRHMKAMEKDGLLAYAGIGLDREETGRSRCA